MATYEGTTILITRTARGFDATFSGKEAANVIRLFGTNVMPTPFTSKAKIQDVMAEIQRLNPGALVITD